MTNCVVDASVAAKWLFDENQSKAARALISPGRRLLAPDLIWAEFGNTVWKRTLRSEITPDEAIQFVADFLRMPLQISPSYELLPASIELALQTGRSAYDCLYLALAIRHDCALVTADQRFVNALSRTSFAKHISMLDRVE